MPPRAAVHNHQVVLLYPLNRAGNANSRAFIRYDQAHSDDKIVREADNRGRGVRVRHKGDAPLFGVVAFDGDAVVDLGLGADGYHDFRRARVGGL